MKHIILHYCSLYSIILVLLLGARPAGFHVLPQVLATLQGAQVPGAPRYIRRAIGRDIRRDAPEIRAEIEVEIWTISRVYLGCISGVSRPQVCLSLWDYHMPVVMHAVPRGDKIKLLVVATQVLTY